MHYSLGHPPMNSYLGLPLRSGKQVIGMVGLANRPGGFDEEIVKFLEPMLSACTNLIEAYTTKRSVLKRSSQYTIAY
jgi:GAF domain-containing protein